MTDRNDHVIEPPMGFRFSAVTIFDELRAGVVTRSAEETQQLAIAFADALPDDTTVALHGDLGVGKTTFVQGLARGFQVLEPVTSPTFTLFNLHRGAQTTLVHLDAYRLENAGHMDALMLEDFLTTPYCLAVEWPERISPWLPAATLHLDLGITADAAHRIQLRT